MKLVEICDGSIVPKGCGVKMQDVNNGLHYGSIVPLRRELWSRRCFLEKKEARFYAEFLLVVKSGLEERRAGPFGAHSGAHLCDLHF